MENRLLRKLGIVLYHIYNMQEEPMDVKSYASCCDKIYEALLDIAPPDKTRTVNEDFKDIIDETNRRLNK